MCNVAIGYNIPQYTESINVDGRIFLVGGMISEKGIGEKYLSDLLEFNEEKKIMVARCPMLKAKVSFGLCSLDSLSFIAVGGFAGKDKGILNVVEKYDLEHNV